MPDTVVCLGALLHHGALRLAQAGLAQPMREAGRIWSDLHDLEPGKSFLDRDRVIEEAEILVFAKAVERRSRGEPLPYVTGRVGFRRLTLNCDRRALIPRPETEGLVDLVLGRAPGGTIADVGTGSGCIGLSLAQEGRYDQVIGIDRSAEALTLAGENRARTGLGITLVMGDLCAALRPGSLDALVANPPYIAEPEYRDLDRAVRAYEPALALVSGPDGLEATGRLLRDGRTAVRPDGVIALEVDANRAAATARAAAELGWNDVSVHDDLFGRARYLLARRSEAG